MQIIISGRHFEVSEPMKQRIEEQLNSLFADSTLKVSTVRVVLALEKSRCMAEITVNIKGFDVQSTAMGYDMYKVVDEAIHKVEVQVDKYIDRVQDHHRKPSLRNWKPSRQRRRCRKRFETGRVPDVVQPAAMSAGCVLK